MAFDDVFLDVLVEDPVDRVEDLRLGYTAATVCDQVFQNAAFATRQGKDVAVDLRITAVGKDSDRTDVGKVGDRLQAAADCSDTGEDFAG